MGSVSRSCCRTPCIQGGSSVVQRNVRQTIPRLRLWNPQPQEMKQTTLASGMGIFDSLDWSLFCRILYEFNDGIWLESRPLLRVAESFSSRGSPNRLEMVEWACPTTSRLMQSIHYSSSYSTF